MPEKIKSQIPLIKNLGYDLCQFSETLFITNPLFVLTFSVEKNLGLQAYSHLWHVFLYDSNQKENCLNV